MVKVSPKFIIFFIVFVNMLGYGILFPLLPLYEQKMHVGPFAISAVMGMYAVAQFFSAPILGILSDRHGRRPWMLFSMVGTLIAFIMFAFAGNIWVLFFARLLDGISGGNIPIAQAYMADITGKENRAEGMGLVSGAMSLGFVVGPVIGGILGQYGVAAPSLVCAFLAFVNLILAVLFLKETEKEEIRVRALKLLPFKEIIRALRVKEIGAMLMLFFLVQTAWSLHLPIFSLFLAKNLALGTLMAGLLMAYRGVISSIVQIFLIGRATKIFGEKNLLRMSIIFMIIGLVITGAAPTLMVLIVGLTIMEFGGDFIGPVVMGMASESAGSSEQGEIMGVAASMGSLGRMIGPYVGGASFELMGASSPFYLGAILMGLGMVFVR